MGLILGRSSSVLKGIKVYPGIIDCHYTGEIKVLIETTVGVPIISRGERIAQLVLLHSFHSANPFNKQAQGDKRFISEKSPGAY